MAGRQSSTSKPRKPAAAAQGPMQKAVAAETRSIVRDLKAGGHRVDGALQALAMTLAKRLDDDGGLATAAISKELRMTLAELAAPLLQAGDADDDARKSFAEFVVNLSTPVRDQAQ